MGYWELGLSTYEFWGNTTQLITHRCPRGVWREGGAWKESKKKFSQSRVPPSALPRPLRWAPAAGKGRTAVSCRLTSTRMSAITHAGPQLWIACLGHEPSLNEPPGSEEGALSPLKSDSCVLQNWQRKGWPLQAPAWLSQVFPKGHFVACCRGLASSPSLMAGGGLRATSGGLTYKTRPRIVKAKCPPHLPAFVCKQKRNLSDNLETKRKAKLSLQFKEQWICKVGRDLGSVIIVKAFCADYVDCL